MPTPILPYIPKYITVHLGAPSSNAENVTVTFPDYIKNVASSEIYPTWNESAISFAVNRVYTEFYYSQGYSFNITNSTAIDQKFIYGRNIFENISNLVDEIFNSYIRRIGNAEPLAAKYCNGTTVTCDGLSQWGSQYLAEQGRNSVQILRYYYGNNIEIVSNVPISNVRMSYTAPVRRGEYSRDVAVIQIALNRISEDYPLIPKIAVDSRFGESTERAVRTFQEIFNLTLDGIVGKATWYKLIYLYTGMTGLSEINSEGQKYFSSSLEYPDAIELGNTGEKVYVTQYLLQAVSWFYPNIPTVEFTGRFNENDVNAVKELQKMYSLPQTGVVDEKTWDVLYQTFIGIRDALNNALNPIEKEITYLNSLNLNYGDINRDVRDLQEKLNEIAETQSERIMANGAFSRQTSARLAQFQKTNGLPQTGILDAETLRQINSVYRQLISNNSIAPTQYPKAELGMGDTDN